MFENENCEQVDQSRAWALEKIKHSFALKARFVVRSVRLAARIVRAKNECGAVEKVVELNEYMDKNYLYISLNIVVLR